MRNYAYLNGKIAPADTAGISIDDIGLLRGYGVFEVIRTFGSKPFLLDKHIERLQRSAKLLNINLPYSPNEITAAVNELLGKNGYPESSIRVVLTGGPVIGGVEYNPASPTFIIQATNFPAPDQKIFSEGIKLVTHEHQRLLPEIKTLNYITAVRQWPAVKKAGANELLYTWGGKVLEASTSNFFIVKDSVLATPKEGVLSGVTRNLIIELAQSEFKIEERDVKTTELAEADEAFITATNKDIMPVVRIDGETIGSGRVGPVTKKIMEFFYDYANSYEAPNF